MQCECTGTQGFHAEVKENASKQYANNSILICLFILETLTCTLLPDNQDWQVTHVGRFRNCSVHLEAD